MGGMEEQNKKGKVIGFLVITLGGALEKKYSPFQGAAPYRASGRLTKRLEGVCLGTQPGKISAPDTSVYEDCSGAVQT